MTAAQAAQAQSQAEAAAAGRAAASSLQRATRAIQAMQATQQAARNAASGAGASVPNGLRPGGLQAAPGATAGSPLWQGASLPTGSSAGGREQVTIRQTQPKAVLTWETFNVGRETDLYFDQRAGGTSAGQWVALNRVIDPSAAPSRILGSISAEGQVYVINRNGIIFGGASQVNVGTLLASTLDIKGAGSNTVADRDQAFLNGLYSTGTAVFQSARVPNGSLLVPGPVEGSVVVEAGAVLRAASASGLADGGRIMLFAPNVSNAGAILAPDGQAVLAAGRTITVTVGSDSQLAFAAMSA
jgi:filamentous hemagglutinin